MGNFYIALHDIPPQGSSIVMDDPAVWQGPLTEFRMGCRVVDPLTAELFLLPAEGGCLVRGRLFGQVAQPCSRCAEDALERLDHAIEVFVALPGPADADGDAFADEAGVDDGHVALEKGVPMLNAASLCWEEFMLALSPRPLCAPRCLGLCARCGANLNAGPCGCPKEEGDPRLAALRKIRIQTPENPSGN